MLAQSRLEKAWVIEIGDFYHTSWQTVHLGLPFEYMSFHEPHPHHAAHLSWGAAGATVLLTVAFHFLMAGRYYGVGFAIFAVALIVVMHGMAILAGRTGNNWAYVFLAPAIMGIAAEAVYANDVVRVVAPMLVAVSLALFSYWLMAPRVTVREVQAFWSRSVVLETLVPAEGGDGMFKHLSFGNHWKKMLMGAGAAVPFLLVIGALFASADPLFRKTIGDILDVKSLPRNFWYVVRDIAVALYLGRWLWSMLSRSNDQRKPTFGKWDFPLDRTMIYTFLGLLNALFLVFIGFQFVYFFGGDALVQQQGITYANYAREGFFQLLAVSAIVFGISWFVYAQTQLRQWALRGLMFALIAETGVVIVSAVRRLLLYVDTYGLTVLRWWALIGICVIAFVLLVFLVSALANWSYGALAKAMTVFCLYLAAGLMLVNVEAMVVRFNAARFAAHGYDRLDLAYFEKLSTDAVPAMVDVYRTYSLVPAVSAEYQAIVSMQVVDPVTGYDYGYSNDQIQNHTLGQNLRDWRGKLQSFADADWRNAVWSDRQALTVLNTLQ